MKGIKRPDGIFPSLPSGIDSVLKKHFDRFRKEGKLPPELVRHKVKARLFDDMKLLDVWRNNRKGIQWKDPKSGILLRGAVDEMLEDDGTLIVLDFKTRGFPLKEDTAGHYQNQIDIYNFLLQKNGYKTANYGYLLFFHPKEVNDSHSFLFQTDLVDCKIGVKNAERLFDSAVEALSGKMPNSDENCEYCRWGRDLAMVKGMKWMDRAV
ncbi:MAG: PD-(D/E)XK nuclease family protein [Candidatus Micrarchaeota archaeon]|nr:PD-(D/E)XK nuclease family protein [Candidatus Micrarchaeota archaeon]